MKKDYTSVGFTLLCVVVAAIFAFLGFVAAHHIESVGWSVTSIIVFSLCAVLYLFLGWAFRPKKKL